MKTSLTVRSVLIAGAAISALTVAACSKKSDEAADAANSAAASASDAATSANASATAADATATTAAMSANNTAMGDAAPPK